MQKLQLYEDIFDALANGKQTTIRKGKINIKLGELLFESSELKRQKTVNVHKVYHCLLAEVSLTDLINDGFKDHKDLSKKMERFYPDITLESEVTVIKFS